MPDALTPARRFLKEKMGHMALVLLLPVLMAACTTNPATGERQFTPFMTPAQERQIGEEQHPQIVAQFGGEYESGDIAGYVQRVGEELAARSELPDMDFTFTVLNSDVVNAFALPGGYVYLTRGIIATFDDEAEMASVLGHEIGHVTARHSAQRYNQSIFAGLGTALVGIFTGNEQLTQLVGQGSQLYLLSYSRGQESQADRLGLRYADRVGYQPLGAVEMLERLQASSELHTLITGQPVDQTPNWARTHPITANRIADMRAHIADQGLDMDAGIRDEAEFKNVIDGMLYGQDPAQGVFRGQSFLHPDLRVAFTAPDGWALQNTASAVIGQSQQAQMIFSSLAAQATQSDQQVLQAAWTALAGDEAPALSNLASLTVDGIGGVTGEAQIETQNGQLYVRTVSFRTAAERAYYFAFVTSPQNASALQGTFFSTAQTFRRLSEEEAAAIRPLIIEIHEVQPGDTVEGLAERMAYDDFRVERFRTLNGLAPGENLTVGEPVKIVVEG